MTSTGAAAAARARILVVDDEEHLRSTMHVLLGRDYDVDVAASAEEALAALDRAPFDVVLSDERMPGTLGTVLLQRVRERWPDVLRFVLTAYNDPDAMMRAINDGEVHRFLLKPCDPQLLRREIREALERRRLEQENRQMRDRLLETERVYALGIVAAGIAHELRNPLTILMGSLEVAVARAQRLAAGLAGGALTLEAAGGEAQQVARGIELARRGVDQIVEITQGIELSQRRRDDQRTCDVEHVVRLTLRSIEGSLRNRGRTIVEAATVPAVRASPTKLGQVLLNLVVNALQALSQERSAENQLTIRYRREAAWVVIEVEDTGPGIPAEELPRVFDPFFTTKPDGGTGLGLAISRRIVEEVGGTIEVTSQLGVGTRFTVRLLAA